MSKGKQTFRRTDLKRAIAAVRRGRSIETARASLERTFHLVGESRWNRKRKLLPGLRIKYPSEQELDEISRQAKTKYPFGEHINSIILDAYLHHASYKNISLPEVRARLARVAELATNFRNN
jgi:hypothetical protein